jgi:hypothetical protein
LRTLDIVGPADVAIVKLREGAFEFLSELMFPAAPISSRSVGPSAPVPVLLI